MGTETLRWQLRPSRGERYQAQETASFPRKGGQQALASQRETLKWPEPPALQVARADAAHTWQRWTTDFAPFDGDEGQDFLDFE